jgi:hypothetical protein
MKVFVATVIATAMAGALIGPRGTAEGLNVVVVVDVTASQHRCPELVAGLVANTLIAPGGAVRSRALDFIPPAIPGFVLNGPRPEDRVRVGALARRIYLSGPHAGDSADLKTAWGNVFVLPPVEWLGPSPIWDVLGGLVELLVTEPGERAVILISDGQASGNRQSASEVASAAKRLGVRISAVGEESLVSTTPPQTMAQAIGKDPLANLKMMADQTGGRFYLDKANVPPMMRACYTLDPAPLLSEAFLELRTSNPGTRTSKF